jgi:hypothetical protein
MIRRPLPSALVLLAATVLLVIGCDSGGEAGSPQGTFTLRLTGASADLDSAVVTIDRATLIGRTDAGEEVARPLRNEARTLDLLRLQDGAMAFLADRVDVPPGTYTQLRLELGATNYAVVDGETVPLRRPPDAPSPIRVVLPKLEVATDEDRVDLTIDFDVEDSVRQRAAEEYELDPAVRVEALFVNGRSVPSVSVKGRVSGVDAGAGRLAVDSLAFSTTARTAFDAAAGLPSLDDLSSGRSVEVEATVLEDGGLRAREVEVGDDSVRSITAFVEAKQDGRLRLLGVPVLVSSDTRFDAGGLGALSVGDRVEVTYDFVDGRRLALVVETEFI